MTTNKRRKRTTVDKPGDVAEATTVPTADDVRKTLEFAVPLKDRLFRDRPVHLPTLFLKNYGDARPIMSGNARTKFL